MYLDLLNDLRRKIRLLHKALESYDIWQILYKHLNNIFNLQFWSLSKKML